MRILYISHTHPSEDNLLANAGGMQRVSYQLVKALEEKDDIQLHTKTIHAGYQGNINVQTARFLIKALFSLKGEAEQFNADIILFSSMVTASVAPFLRNKINKPMVTINHGQDVTLPVKIYQQYLPKVFKALDGVISVSRATRQQCIKRGMEPEKGIALPNGVDIDRFIFPDKQTSRKALEQEFNIPLKNHKMLLTVGRFVERKGHQWFIKNVLPLLKNDVVYVTVGSGPELESVKNKVKYSPVAKNIFILGRQPDDVLKRTYAASDLFIMPNVPVAGDMEGFGIVMVEANLAQTPVIASDIEGIKDVVTEGKNGYKVQPLDEKAFAEKIDETLLNNLSLLSTRSCKFVKEHFNWQYVANCYVHYLKKVADKFSQMP